MEPMAFRLYAFLHRKKLAPKVTAAMARERKTPLISMTMRKPQILIAGSIPPPYHGSTVVVQSLLNSRLREEFHILHLDTSDHRGFENLGKFDLINISLGLKNLLQLAAYCIFRKPDIVCVLPGTNTGSCLREGLFIILTKALSEAKVVAHFHTSSFKDFYLKSGKLLQRFIDSFLKKTDHAIVLGQCFREMLACWLTADKIHVVPNGTSFDPYQGKAMEKSFHPGHPVRITYMSNIDPTKGILILLRALKSIVADAPPFTLTIAGAWTSSGLAVKEQVDSFIDRGPLRETVHFIGIVKGTKKEDLLKETDIFVLPSLSEAQPLSILEAMAARCPVVSTRHGAIPETVSDGQTGILVEKENVAELARALKKLIENPKLRENMGLLGRKRYEQCYTKDKHIENMILVFKKSLGLCVDNTERRANLEGAAC